MGVIREVIGEIAGWYRVVVAAAHRPQPPFDYLPPYFAAPVACAYRSHVVNNHTRW